MDLDLDVNFDFVLNLALDLEVHEVGALSFGRSSKHFILGAVLILITQQKKAP